MSVIVTKPTSPGRRFMIKANRSALSKDRPYSSLVKSKLKTGGRNNGGCITVRHRGGGSKKFYRMIDFKRRKDGIVGRVERLEYDPNRSAYIALILYADGERRYIIAPKDLRVGNEISSGIDVSIKKGNCLPLRNIPVGTIVHCIELKPGKGAQLVRSAGTFAQLVAKEGEYATLKLRSGEVHKVMVHCRACIGEVSNQEHNLCALGKAGATRWRGRRPCVRGEAMNPVDHPHGGRTRGGRHPVSPWGMPTKGYRTRKNKRTGKFIVRSRHATK